MNTTPKDTSQLNKSYLLFLVTNRLTTETLRIKKEIERIDMEIDSLYTNACSLTGVYTSELSDSLQSAFQSLQNGLPFSQPGSSIHSISHSFLCLACCCF